MDNPFNPRRRRRNHLDATAGREVVFCHQCRNEWYNDEYPGLDCPECGSGASEIVTDDHDPRGTFDFPSLNFSSTRSPPPHPPTDGDSDPEEDDIDSFARDTTGYAGAYRPRRQPGANSEDILSRFTEMLMNDLGGSRPPNRRTHPPLFPPGTPRDDAQAGGQASGPTPAESMNPFFGFPPPGAPATVQRATFRSGPSGSTTYTIVSSSSVQTGSGANFASPFSALFGQLMGASFGENGPQAGGAGTAGDAGTTAGAGPRPMWPNGLEGGVQALLASLLNPQAAVHGDAVYSQEALDRIITSLMEANPQSNAAPPATDDAIGRLEKKQVDDKMLGAEGKAECTICMDDLTKGEEVTVLPCSHWFHGECVTLWLKQHNTCPICRAAIEQRNGRGGGAQQQPQQQQQPQPEQQQQQPPRWDQPRTGDLSGARMLFGTSFMGHDSEAPRSRPVASYRTARENEQRLHAIRTAANSEGDSEFQSNNPFLARRDSRSPTRRSYVGGYTRQRVRSPSSQDHEQQRTGWSFHDNAETSTGTRLGSNNNRDGRDRDNDSQNGQANSGGGPLSWFRNHFGHGSGGSSDRGNRGR